MISKTSHSEPLSCHSEPSLLGEESSQYRCFGLALNMTRGLAQHDKRQSQT